MSNGNEIAIVGMSDQVSLMVRADNILPNVDKFDGAMFGRDFPIERALETIRLSSSGAVIASRFDSATKAETRVEAIERRLEAAE